MLLLHVLCLIILWRYDKPRKQCFIVTVLVSELFVGVLQIAIFLLECCSDLHHIVTVTAYTINIPYCGGLILLTLERYMEVYLHIKYYASYFYLYRLKFCIALWVTNACVAFYVVAKSLAGNLPPFTRVYHINLYFLHAAHGVILVLFSVVYMYLYRLFRQTNQHQLYHKQRRTKLNKSKIFAPFFIVLTFLCFLTVPMVLFVYVFPDSDKSWVLVLNRANSITDVLLYVLFNPRIRKKFMKRKSKRTLTPRIVAGAQTTETTQPTLAFAVGKGEISSNIPTGSSQQTSIV